MLKLDLSLSLVKVWHFSHDYENTHPNNLFSFLSD